MNSFNTLIKKHGFEPIEETETIINKENIELRVKRLEKDLDIPPDESKEDENA
jgi:hypothetical protein